MTVVAPSSVSEVGTLIGEARDSGQPLWFIGSGTTPVPDQHTIVSTRDISGIVDYKPDDLTVVVRCGTTLAELDEVLKEHDHTSVMPETAPERTVGGVIASGASGYRRLRYGPTRDRVIGIRFATGYGEAVSAGGQLVKNVTGYDIPRLMTGSHGALGFISEVSLKLWPVPDAPRTVQVEDPASARTMLYKPVAALETESDGFVYVSGPRDPGLEGSETSGYIWPSPVDEAVVVAVNVQPRLVPEAIGRIRDLGADRFVAQHGVGVVDVGWSAIGESQILDVRSWAESRGGSLVLHRRGPLAHMVSRWGAAPQTIHLQRRLKALFDPDGVCNPGVLPGGV
jgi:FAD/FMN-containing dehydrogenase